MSSLVNILPKERTIIMNKGKIGDRLLLQCLQSFFNNLLAVTNRDLTYISELLKLHLRTVDVVLEEAVKFLRQSAGEGDSSNTFLYGACCDIGIGVSKNKEEALKWYIRACELGSDAALYTVGEWLHNINQEETDRAAYRCLNISSAKGNSRARYLLAWCILSGKGVHSDEMSAIQLFKLSADQGLPSALYILGVYYSEGRSVVKDLRKAVYFLKSAAVQGHNDSLYVLSIVLCQDACVEKNELEAIQNLRLCAEMGHIKAACRLARWYDNGSDVKRTDQSSAFNNYKIAADGANSYGQLKVAMCYADGKGVEQNQAEAFRYFTKAAKQNSAEALFWLGGYYSIKGDKKMKKWAFKFFKMAADNEHCEAQTKVGYCFMRGLGVGKNMVEAGYYYRMASESEGMEECGEIALIIDSLFGRNLRLKHRVVQKTRIGILSIFDCVISYLASGDTSQLFKVLNTDVFRPRKNNLMHWFISSRSMLPRLPLARKRSLRTLDSSSGRVVSTPRTDEFQLDDKVDCSVGVNHHMHSGEVHFEPHDKVSKVELVSSLHLKYDDEVSEPALLKEVNRLRAVRFAANKFLSLRKATVTSMDSNESMDEGMEVEDAVSNFSEIQFRTFPLLKELGLKVHKYNYLAHCVTNGRQLLKAAHYNNVNAVQTLLERGVAVDYCEADGVTPMLIATFYGLHRLQKLLSAAGAAECNAEGPYLPVVIRENLSLINKFNLSRSLTLSDCCRLGLADSMKAFLDTGADLSETDDDGLTALYYACKHRYIERVSDFLLYGANVERSLLESTGTSWYSLLCQSLDTRFHYAFKTNDIDSIKHLNSIGMMYDSRGSSMLIEAVKHSSEEVVSLVLSFQHCVDYTDRYEMTALMWASYRGSASVVQLLLNVGATVDKLDSWGLSAGDHAEIGCNDDIVSLLKRYELKRSRKVLDDDDDLMDEDRSVTVKMVRCESGMEEMTISEEERDDGKEKSPFAEVLAAFQALPSASSALSVISALTEFLLKEPLLTDDAISALGVVAAFADAAINRRDPNTLDSLLHIACHLDHPQAVKFLLENPCIDVNIRNGQLNTPLIIVAMTSQNLEIVSLLLAKNANSLCQNDQECTAVHFAAKSANKELLYLLLDYVGPSRSVPNVLQCICEHKESDATADTRYALVESLLKQGRYGIDDINELGDTIQIHCCRHGLTKLVNLTISFGANPEIANRNGETALKLSVKKPWWHAISANSYTAFWTALKNNNIAEIKRLIKAGVDLNVPNDKGEYALFTAIQSSSDEVVAVLISLGANVNIVQDGTTPLLLASSRGYAGKVAMLIDAGANLTAVDSRGNTFLHLAGAGGFIEALKVGLYKAMKLNPSVVSQLVNVRNSEGWTPVMCAAKSVSKESVDFLTAAGSKSTKDHFLEDEAEEARRSAEAARKVDQSAPMEVVTTTPSSSLTTAAASAGSGKPGSTPGTSAAATSSEPEVFAPPNEVPIQKMLNRTEIEVIYHACKFGLTSVVLTKLNTANIQRLINQKVEEVNYVMVKDKLTEVITSETCLYVACYYGHTEIVAELLKCRADPNIPARNGWSCLFVSAKKGYLEIVTNLIAHGADVHLKNRNDMTPLNIAAYGGFLDIVKLLISHNADVNQGDKMGARPLHAAIQSGKYEVADYLLDHGADINGKTNTDIGPLYVASYSGNERMVERFLSYTPPEGPKFAALKTVDIDAMNKEGLTPITVAAFNGHLNIVKMLLNAGADMNKTEKKKVTALYAACQNGFIDVVNLLLSCKADPNTPIGNLNTPVHAVAIENKYEILKVLISHGAAIDITNVDGVTPLYMACEKGHIETLTILIDLGANVNTPNKHTVSPLNIASQNGHVKIVKKLLEHKAFVNSQTEDGPTPLFISAQNGHTEICRMLLEAGADVDTRTKEKESAIFVAGYFGYAEIVKLLITYKASVNIVDRDTRTPLWWACKAGQEDVVKLLMDAGADVNISDREHVTPMMIAAQQRKSAVCELLNAAKAQATLCAICLTNQRCVLFMPCKHLASCADCSLKLQRTSAHQCPICRTAVSDVLTVFT